VAVLRTISLCLVLSVLLSVFLPTLYNIQSKYISMSRYAVCIHNVGTYQRSQKIKSRVLFNGAVNNYDNMPSVAHG